jgi:hypothetical protein
MAKTIHRCDKKTRQSACGRIKKETSLCKQNGHGNAAATDASNANLYGTLLYVVDICISSNLWTNSSSFTYRNSMDNV